MSTPADHPFIFLFTGDSGHQHGYQDGPRKNGLYWYTGEGQRGDMEFIRANAAVLNHKRDHKRVFLFEAIGKGWVRFEGEVEYLGHHSSEMPDTDGNMRTGIVFELGFLTGLDHSAPVIVAEPERKPTERSLFAKPLHELRRLAMQPANPVATREEKRHQTYVRSEAVRVYVLKRAGDNCEGCDQPAPFKTPKGRPYLEPHHTKRLADGGPDHPAWVIALCPTCHRRVHHGAEGDEYNAALIARLSEIEDAI